ncbi:hypothetical protein EVAR_94293_1 [Eumeta japonica]|uniref:Uncharacterized protein n=1 Tax=Eumeta variegata TaxID=151549 RepID=A0A4C1UF84_EUMVA|nr:hypothetical protein EVAR_94293_1 [Eumeta japonica]
MRSEVKRLRDGLAWQWGTYRKIQRKLDRLRVADAAGRVPETRVRPFEILGVLLSEVVSHQVPLSPSSVIVLLYSEKFIFGERYDTYLSRNKPADGAVAAERSRASLRNRKFSGSILNTGEMINDFLTRATTNHTPCASEGGSWGHEPSPESATASGSRACTLNCSMSELHAICTDLVFLMRSADYLRLVLKPQPFLLAEG